MNPLGRVEENAQNTAINGTRFSAQNWGKEVQVASKLEPGPSHFWEHPIDNICLFFRETAESLYLSKPSFPQLDDYPTNNEKLKAIGHYLMRCEKLGVEPDLPPGFTIDPDSTPISDPEILLAKLTLEYFHPDNDGKHLVLEGGIVFVKFFNEYISEQLAGEQAKAEGGVVTITPSCIDSYLIEQGKKPSHLSTSVIDMPNKSGLTPRMVFAIRLLGVDKKNLTSDQKEFLANFLNTVPCNRALNKALRSLSPEKLERYQLDEAVVKDLSRISFKTRESKVFKEAFEKLQFIDKLIKADESIPPELRLTLHEVDILDKHAGISDLMLKHSPYYDVDSKTFAEETNENKEHIGICRQLEQTKELTEDLTKKVVNELGLQSGDIIQNIGKKFLSMGGSRLNQNEAVRYWVSEYRHSGKVCMVDGKPRVSDMWDKYRNFSMDLENLLVSDFQRINAHVLVHDLDVIEKLEKKYGDQWEAKVNELYREIEEEVHGDVEKKKFKGLINTRQQQMKVGLTYLLPHLHESRSTERTYDKLHDKIMDGHYDDNTGGMVCSEFAAKTTIAVLFELNLRLKEELGVDTDVIEMPFGPREKLHYINPDRLTAILQEAGCIEDINPGETFAKYFVVDAVKGVKAPVIKEED